MDFEGGSGYDYKIGDYNCYYVIDKMNYTCITVGKLTKEQTALVKIASQDYDIASYTIKFTLNKYDIIGIKDNIIILTKYMPTYIDTFSDIKIFNNYNNMSFYYKVISCSFGFSGSIDSFENREKQQYILNRDSLPLIQIHIPIIMKDDLNDILDNVVVSFVGYIYRTELRRKIFNFKRFVVPNLIDL